VSSAARGLCRDREEQNHAGRVDLSSHGQAIVAGEWDVSLSGQTRGPYLDRDQLSRNCGSWLQVRCSEAAQSAEECPHHALQTLVLCRRGVRKVRLMVAL
jgi:hypothetical protein